MAKDETAVAKKLGFEPISRLSTTFIKHVESYKDGDNIPVVLTLSSSKRRYGNFYFTIVAEGRTTASVGDLDHMRAVLNAVLVQYERTQVYE